MFYEHKYVFISILETVGQSFAFYSFSGYRKHLIGWLFSLILSWHYDLDPNNFFLKKNNCYFSCARLTNHSHDFYSVASSFNTNPKFMKSQPSYEWSAWHTVNKGSPMLLSTLYLVPTTHDLTAVAIKRVDI